MRQTCGSRRPALLNAACLSSYLGGVTPDYWRHSPHFVVLPTGDRQLNLAHSSSATPFLLGGTIPKWRTGSTCNMSTRGVSFHCGEPLPLSAHIEMVLDWPVRYDAATRSACGRRAVWRGAAIV